jgi:hypothetical protein
MFITSENNSSKYFEILERLDHLGIFLQTKQAVTRELHGLFSKAHIPDKQNCGGSG